MSALLMGLASIALGLLMVANVVAVLRLRRKLKATEKGLLYARGAAQEFCRLCGGSQRMLRRVATMWGADPLLLDAALNTLSDVEQSEIRLTREGNAVRLQCQKIDDTTKTYSEFMGQTPFLKEVGIRGAK